MQNFKKIILLIILIVLETSCEYKNKIQENIEQTKEMKEQIYIQNMEIYINQLESCILISKLENTEIKNPITDKNYCKVRGIDIDLIEELEINLNDDYNILNGTIKYNGNLYYYDGEKINKK